MRNYCETLFYTHNNKINKDDKFVVHKQIKFYQIVWDLYTQPSEDAMYRASIMSNWVYYLIVVTVTAVLFLLANIIYLKNVQLQKEFAEREKIQELMWQNNKLKALGTLAGGVAHDFNNFLMGIQGQLSLIREIYLPALENHSHTSAFLKLNKSLDSIGNVLVRAKELTSQILTFSRHADTDLALINPRIVIEDAIMMTQQSHNPQVSIAPYFESDAVILGNQTKFLQVIINLLVNAIDAINAEKSNKSSGYVQISMYSVPFALSHDAFEDFQAKYSDISFNYTESLRIEVIDDGCGMSEEEQQQVFDPFYSTKSIGKGTGLGLSIAQQIIFSFGGMISLYSELDVGTVVQIDLPVVNTVSAPEVKIVSHATATLSQLTHLLQKSAVLIVDDDITIATSIAEYFKYKCAATYVASNGYDALELFELHKSEICLTILDINMPEMNGTELYERLIELKPSLKTIFITGFAETHTPYLDNDNVVVLEKPFEIVVLENTILQLFTQ